MKRLANRVLFQGEVSHRNDADVLLKKPGAVALVYRGVARSIAMACPDGCGETLTINLDDRAGPAWRLYRGSAGISLFPSVWRETGCKAHFIIWRSKIYWCNRDAFESPTADVLERTLAHLNDEFVSFSVIADQLSLIPWEVLAACDHLVSRGLAERGRGERSQSFRRQTHRRTEKQSQK